MRLFYSPAPKMQSVMTGYHLWGWLDGTFAPPPFLAERQAAMRGSAFPLP
ncbi:hypothetical protein AA0313_0721 [Acetobacter indonesiensis NRIC 0313]|uniref:Uncharacterized protein n=1 Tax=Acetobacter indonesiensis TaxID=104101 RepID=A0A6N3T759_9PROT|nr:hypothetical protein Abin_053_047 [Acetobacter indonesiensis]GBQ54989.1 hypothetical protein AA0313_0721 [Acetobacter indonesiensis NRIC 0313]GEN03784.1 hypothetical protein AIN02nite_18090 [Acetobacter indonesiensis]